MKKITNIVILAGGDGDRFWPSTDKWITPFLGKPFLSHLIDNLLPYGEHIYVVGSAGNKEKIQQHLSGKAAFILQKDVSLGMAGAVRACKGVVRGNALIIGNDYIDFRILDKLIEKTNSGGAALLFLAKKMNSVYFPGGYVVLKDGKVTGIIEKPAPDNLPSDLVNLVVDYFQDIDGFISILEKTVSDRDDIYEKGMNEYMQAGKADYIEYDGFWQSLKYPWHVLRMDRIMRESIRTMRVDESSFVADNAVIEGNVVVGRNCKIGNFVKISGPCYIGDGTVIGDYSLIRESSIGSNTLVGAGCEVARSYLGDNVSLHRNYVGDSLLSNGVLFGAGAVTANFRFDQKHVFSTVGEKKVDTGSDKMGAIIGEDSKIGVNSTLYPGIKIGRKCVVSPGETLSHDVPDGMFVSGGELKKNIL